MITNKGKSIIAKYMLGQIPAYASYLALGCGASPSSYSRTPTAYSISGSTVTVTFASGVNDFVAGESIVVSFGDSRVDGSKTVLTTSSTQITFAADYAIPSLTAVDDANPATGYARYTSASAHRLVVGDLITTTGFASTEFNNTNVAVYAVTSSTSFVIVEAGTGATGTGTLSTITPTLSGSAVITRDYAGKKALDFEMLRVPITSRGLALEDGLETLVFGAESPTQDRLSISEIGIFSAGTNNTVVGSQSGIMHTFANYENWELHSTGSATTIENYAPVLSTDGGATISLSSTTLATYLSSDSAIFNNAERVLNLEQPRMYDSTLVIGGNLTGGGGGTGIVGSTAATLALANPLGTNDSRHVHLTGQTYAFDENSSSDEIKVAFSVMEANVANALPTSVSMIVEFSSESVLNPTDAKYARLKIYKTAADMAKTRYFVESVSLADLEVSDNFAWSSVDTVKIYCTVLSGGGPSSQYFVALDAIRFENVYDEEQNPSYGMTGYSVINTTQTIGATTYTVPVEKDINRSNLIEYKFPITVGEI